MSLPRLEFFQLAIFSGKSGSSALLKIFQKSQRARPRLGHATRQHEVSEMRLPKHRRFFSAQGQNTCY